MVDAILTLNAGSSSIKFALFEVGRDEALAVTARGEVESVNDKPHFLARGADGGTLAERRWDGRADFDDLLEEMIAWAEGHLSDDRLVAVGHRVVHGGSDHVRPERVTAGLIEALNRLTPLAPLHEPHTIAPMKAIARLRKTLPQVACFDTAFHHTMPDVARRFALPRDLNDAGVRRYGFHGQIGRAHV